MDKEIELYVQGVTLTPQEDFVLVLSDQSYQKLLPIKINDVSAESIMLFLDGEKASPPLIHDFLHYLCLFAKIKFKKIIISDLFNNVFYSTAYLEYRKKEVKAKMCIGDSIVMALKFNIPIFLKEELLEFTFNSNEILIKPNNLH